MNNRDIINELSKRYKELQEEFKSVQDLVNDIDFVFDYTEEEQFLFYRMRSTMEEHLAALLRLIRFLKKQELEEQGIKDWSQYKKTDSDYIGVDVSDEGDHGACRQVCGDGIATQEHHCGQDASVQDPNESQPADAVPESLKKLVGMQIFSVMPPGWKCQGCAFDIDYFRCEKKVELVGGYMLCLAQLPIVTE